MTDLYEALAEFDVEDNGSKIKTEVSIRKGHAHMLWIEQPGNERYGDAFLYLDEAGIRVLAEVTARLVAILDNKVH